jgi:hypothetical protein
MTPFPQGRRNEATTTAQGANVSSDLEMHEYRWFENATFSS